MPLPKPKKDESKDEFVSRCMGNSTMKNEFPKQVQLNAVRNQQWEQRNNRRGDSGPYPVRDMLSVNARADTDAIRTETFQGVEHLVVPVVALVEGVLWPSNAPAPELALADEFGQHAASWDGRPVVLDHPKRGGIPVSANRPDVLEQEAFGQLFNSKLDGKKLKTEAWINLDRVAELSKERPEIQETVERLQSGELVEVSTGLFMALEEVEGVYNGETFEGVWRDVKSDHLALLPAGVIGACSVEDGCGTPRTQRLRGNYMGKTSKSDPSCECQRQNGELEGGGEEQEQEQQSSSGVGTFKALMGRLGNLLQFRSNQKELSDIDVRRALEAALLTEGSEYFWIVAVFDNHFVYEPDFSGELVSRSFEISEDGGVSLTGDKVPVRPVTEFVPVKVNEEEESMTTNTEGEGEGEVEVEGGATTGGTTETTAEGTSTEETEREEETRSETSEEPSRAATRTTETPRTADEYVAQAPAEVREVLEEGLRMQREERDSLVSSLKDNPRCEFDESELRGMELKTLRRMHRLAASADYTGRAGHQFGTRQNASEDQTIPEPPTVFPKKAAGK